MPATVASVKTYLGIDPATVIDDQALGAVVAAANDYITQLRPDLTLGEDGTPLPTWPPRVDQAANVEASRLYGRRGSVQGVAAFADIGVSLLPRIDPEVASLLELGNYQRSVVA